MICFAVPVRSEDDARKGLDAAEGVSDLAELRMDFCEEAGEWFSALLQEKTVPVIVTDRAKEEGGNSPRTLEARMELLSKAAESGADYIDCEYQFLSGLPEIDNNVKIIGSYHNFETFPSDIEDIFTRIQESRADIIKVAVKADDIGDNFRLFEVMQKMSKPMIGICMGEKGEISRILGKKYGSLLTYAVPEGYEMTAAGQVTIEEMKEVYRYNGIDKDTQVFGVAGNPVKHSASPAIHNAALKALGIKGVYVKFLVDDIVKFMEYFKKFSFSGLSVTIPHKVPVMDSLDSIDELAADAGAVNTVCLKNGKLNGANTDIKAAIDRLSQMAGGLQGKRTAVLGAGGAARGICFGLRKEGADILIVNRTIEKAEKLAHSVGCSWSGYDDFSGDGFDILINTTSVGMSPDIDRSPVSEDVIKPGMIVFDVIYNPPDTRLIRMAQKKQCETLTGVDMFLAQAQAQFRIWLGESAPEGVMEKAFKNRIEST